MSLLRIDIRQYTTPLEFFLRHTFFFLPINWDRVKETPLQPSEHIVTALDGVHDIPEESWNADNIRTVISDAARNLSETSNADQENLDTAGPSSAKTEKAVQKELNIYLRWAMMGGSPGPSIPQSMELLGRDVVLKRLERAAQQHHTKQFSEGKARPWDG